MLTRLERLLQVHATICAEADAEIKSKFPVDSEVLFKFANMTDYQMGIVVRASFCGRNAEVRVINTKTNKTRDIPLSAIVIEPDSQRPGDIIAATRKDRRMAKSLRKLGASRREIAAALGVPEDSPIITEVSS